MHGEGEWKSIERGIFVVHRHVAVSKSSPSQHEENKLSGARWIRVIEERVNF